MTETTQPPSVGSAPPKWEEASPQALTESFGLSETSFCIWGAQSSRPAAVSGDRCPGIGPGTPGSVWGAGRVTAYCLTHVGLPEYLPGRPRVCHFPGKIGWGAPSLLSLLGSLIPWAAPAHGCHPRAYFWLGTHLVRSQASASPSKGAPVSPDGSLSHPVLPVQTLRLVPQGPISRVRADQQGVGPGETEWALEGGIAEALVRPRAGGSGTAPSTTEEPWASCGWRQGLAAGLGWGGLKSSPRGGLCPPFSPGGWIFSQYQRELSDQ